MCNGDIHGADHEYSIRFLISFDMLVTLENDDNFYHIFSASVCTSVNFINAHQKNPKVLVVILKAFE